MLCTNKCDIYGYSRNIYSNKFIFFTTNIKCSIQDKKDIVWNYLAIYFVLAIVNILFERVYNLYFSVQFYFTISQR